MVSEQHLKSLSSILRGRSENIIGPHAFSFSPYSHPLKQIINMVASEPRNLENLEKTLNFFGPWDLKKALIFFDNQHHIKCTNIEFTYKLRRLRYSSNHLNKTTLIHYLYIIFHTSKIFRIRVKWDFVLQKNSNWRRSYLNLNNRMTLRKEFKFKNQVL